MNGPFPTLSLSVVIPCRDEEAALPGLARALQPWGQIPRLELLFVDDGSRDGTREAARKHFPAARVLVHPRPLGLGAALRTGSRAASGELVAWFDADASYDPALLPRMTELLLEREADAVLASPWHPEGGSQGVPWSRTFPSRTISKIYSLLGPGRLYTYTGLFRVHRRDLLLRALPVRPGFPGVTESLLRFLLLGGKVLEVPAVLHSRKAGSSKMRILQAAGGHLELLGALLLGKLAPAGRNQEKSETPCADH
ncbi:MAG TPA: glycosyltransferase family 2 protein [Planctomycetes bacterium]|nr:glycosyltransferase family 2 protein [Planctomycetota bacterium]